MILVPTPSHTEQLNNAKQAERLGAAKMVHQEDLNKENLLKTIKQVLKSDMQERLERIKAKVAEYNGLENAVKIIAETAEQC